MAVHRSGTRRRVASAARPTFASTPHPRRSGHADRIYSVMVPAWKVNDGKRGELSSEEQAKVREARRELASVSAPLPSIFFELEDRPDPTPSPVV